jgi:hypothetical protein
MVAAAAIDLGLLVLILKMDANYLEAAATISQKVYEQLRRTKQGGGLAMPATARGMRIHLPRLPWLGGAGPIAWRQLMLAIRTSRHAIITSLGLAAIFLVASLFSARRPGGSILPPGAGVGMTLYLTFVFSLQLPWAFRGDLDHMDFLKTLPISPPALAVGELAGGVVLMTSVQLVMLVLFWAVDPESIRLTLTVALFAAPFNALILTLSNLLFLLYPVRLMTGTSFDFQSFGRMMLFFMLQMLLLLPLLGIPAAAGGLAYLLTGGSWPVFALTTWLMLLAEEPPLVILVAWAFQRFDPSTETPAA